MEKYLGLKPGAVSPFGPINDRNKDAGLFPEYLSRCEGEIYEIILT
ncbi:MAG: hypothetical protein LKI53_02710 [Bacteroidales bacterium]|jgi:hypothetical protein|nr:hypothetical protein [Bacteroidales bacterium]